MSVHTYVLQYAAMRAPELRAELLQAVACAWQGCKRLAGKPSRELSRLLALIDPGLLASRPVLSSLTVGQHRQIGQIPCSDRLCVCPSVLSAGVHSSWRLSFSQTGRSGPSTG